MQLGRVIAGRYRVESKLGEGGFGAVFRATELGSGASVALKLLHVDALLRDETRARFRREARLAQTISHPNVVKLLDFGETEEGVPFIAWELLLGRSLDEELRASGPLPLERVARIAKQALSALAAAHRAGIVHRDVKPANVFLLGAADGGDDVRVLDFGIAAVSSELASQTLTREGTTVGTPAYMSPEQVLAEPLDGRADLYSLGLMLAECVAGQPVYRGATAMRVAIEQASSAPVPLPSEVASSPLGPILLRATDKDRSRRFASADEMLAAIDALPLTESGSIVAAPAGPTPFAATSAPPPAPAAPRAALPVVAAGVLVLGVLAVASTLWLVVLRDAHTPTISTCPGGPLPEHGCAFHGRSLAEIDRALEQLGYVHQAMPMERSDESTLHKGDATIVVLLARSSGGTPVHARGVAQACWAECNLTVAVHSPTLDVDGRQAMADDIVRRLTP